MKELIGNEGDPDIAEGLRRYLSGEPLNFSTDITDYLSWGYGELDPNGFWQYPVPFALLSPKDRERIQYIEGRPWIR